MSSVGLGPNSDSAKTGVVGLHRRRRHRSTATLSIPPTAIRLDVVELGRRIPYVELALAKHHRQLTVRWSELHFEGARANHGLVLHAPRKLHQIRIELAGELTLRANLADLRFAVYCARGAHGKRRCGNISFNLAP